ncbi:MAG TPA: D-amino acid aminotransferase, partial [Rhodospirillaceae bacterium]|nr:D-amino acid aminotransferase [Rhodospirillaceae bacterium]
RHFERLLRSLDALSIDLPVSLGALPLILEQLIRRNRLRHGLLYIQITRGVSRREHAFPAAAASSLVMTLRHNRPTPSAVLNEGARVISIPDIRWHRCDIKSISLLPNILGKQAAKAAGAYEAWMINKEGFVTEGTSTNAWIIDKSGTLLTHPANHSILNGITRMAVIDLARSLALKLDERAFSLAEALAASEAFLTSTTGYVLPVTKIDGHAVGDGRPGPLTLRLRQAYETAMIGASHA